MYEVYFCYSNSSNSGDSNSNGDPGTMTAASITIVIAVEEVEVVAAETISGITHEHMRASIHICLQILKCIPAILEATLEASLEVDCMS